MTGNISKDDRVIRVVIGLWFISMVFIGPATLWGWVGIVPLLTAAVGFCPLYKRMGFDTKKAAAEIEVIEVAEEIKPAKIVKAVSVVELVEPSSGRETGAA